MSEPIDERVREMVRATRPETKEAVLFDLIDELTAMLSDEPRLPILASAKAFREDLVRLANGECEVPPTPEEIAEAGRNREKMRLHFNWTHEELAEYERRELGLDLDAVMDADEFKRRLREKIPAGSR
jgi:hypothetical protein